MKNWFNRVGTGKDDATTETGTYYVTGSGLVPIPVRRINSIPKLIAEHHHYEAQHECVRAAIRRA